jgi:sterol desaturase/sphingolipid hydroxylase (fatty acid hydroxylase superfamily)
MFDEITKLALFILTGVLFWFVSKHLYMREYPPKRLERFDYFFIFIALGLAGAYDAFIAPMFLWVMAQSEEIVPGARLYLVQQSFFVQMSVYFLLSDFLSYWAHRLLHKSNMWRFHALHHSSISLNWVSGLRGGPIHLLLILTPEVLMAGLFIPSNNAWMLPVLAIAGFLNQHMIHTSIRLPCSKLIEYVFVTPRMHFVHHHPDMRYTNSNYGFVFSIWDRLFGTYVDADLVNQKGLLGTDYPATKLEMFLGLTPKGYQRGAGQGLLR